MSVNVKEKEENKKKGITKLLWKEKKNELVKILAFWEKYKKEWENLKEQFREKYSREKFIDLVIHYEKSKSSFLNNLDSEEKQIIGPLKWLTREKFFDKYLNERILYWWEFSSLSGSNDCIKYDIEDFKEWRVKLKKWVLILLELGNLELWDEWVEKLVWKIKLKEWVYLDLRENHIWDKWCGLLSKLKLKEWVALDLSRNNIWCEWVSILAEKMEFKDGVSLQLDYNNIWDEWAVVIANKMKLKKHMILNLSTNKIWDEWAEEILKHMELKKWIKINLSNNLISEKMKEKLKEWEKNNNDKWLKCEIKI